METKKYTRVTDNQFGLYLGGRLWKWSTYHDVWWRDTRWIYKKLFI